MVIASDAGRDWVGCARKDAARVAVQDVCQDWLGYLLIHLLRKKRGVYGKKTFKGHSTNPPRNKLSSGSHCSQPTCCVAEPSKAPSKTYVLFPTRTCGAKTLVITWQRHPTRPPLHHLSVSWLRRSPRSAHLGALDLRRGYDGVARRLRGRAARWG